MRKNSKNKGTELTIFIICAFVLPVVGNMVCDHRVKAESKRKKVEAAEAQINATAEAVADLLD